MKKIITKAFLLVLVLTVLPLTACSQKRMLSELPSGEGVSKIFISKYMVQLGAKIGAKEMGEYSHLLDEITGIEVYSCENAQLKPKVNEIWTKELEKYNASELVAAEEDNEESYIYLLSKDKDGTEPIGLAIVSSDKNEMNIVVIQGEINLDAVAELISQVK